MPDELGIMPNVEVLRHDSGHVVLVLSTFCRKVMLKPMPSCRCVRDLVETHEGSSADEEMLLVLM